MFYAQNLRLIRKVIGYTQEEFIKKLNLTRGKLQSYEHGRVEPPIDLLVFLQNETNIPIYDILTRELSDTEIIAKQPMPEVHTRSRGYGLSGVAVSVQERVHVYGKEAIKDLYNFEALIQEVQRLREEVDQLKKLLK